jgi:tetratricopeptide (TPR) repeat protein
LPEAEGCFRELIQLRRTLGSADIPYRIYDLKWMSEILVAEGKLEQDEALLREALAVARKYYTGEPSRNVEWIARDLADVLDKRKNYAQAKPLAQEAANLYQSHADWSPTERISAFKVLANVLSESGDLAGAETISRQRLQFLQSTQPSNSVLIVQSLGDLATILARENKLPESESTYRERLAAQRNLSSTNTAPITATLKALADVLKKEGKTNESQALLHPAPVAH